MSVKKVFLVIALSLLIVSNVNAFVSAIPTEIEFEEIPKQITFQVSNDDSIDRQLFVKPFFPVEHIFLEKPGVIKAGETKKVAIKFFPRTDLLETEFLGTIEISLGTKTAEKNIRMIFSKQTTCPVSINSTVSLEENEGQKTFLIQTKLENQKQEQAEILLKNIVGLPQSWNTLSNELSKIGPTEKITHQIILTPGETFDGEIEIEYLCDGFLEKRTIKISHNSENELFSEFTGLFSFGLLEGFDESFFSSELLLNIILIIIASFLLIAFISRLVTKLSGKKSIEAEPSKDQEVLDEETEINGAEPVEEEETELEEESLEQEAFEEEPIDEESVEDEEPIKDEEDSIEEEQSDSDYGPDSSKRLEELRDQISKK